jgi:hypothetical protein
MKILYILALSIGTLSAQVELHRGTYTEMTGFSAAPNAVWVLTDACASGGCTQGGCVGGFALCAWNGTNWSPFIPGGGAAPPVVTGTIYGGFTGGGSTVVVDDTDCPGSGDSRAAIQTKITALSSGDTLDFQATNTCDITAAAALAVTNKTNIRITTSVTPPTNGTLRATVTGLYLTPESALMHVLNCTNCLFDKLRINGNGKAAEGIFTEEGDHNSVQNVRGYGSIQDNTGTGAYAFIKAQNETDSFWVGNNISDLGGVAGGEGMRCFWIGVGSEPATRPTIINNTCASPGHSGIATESEAPVVTGNLINNVAVNGTCFKLIPKGSSAVTAVFENNTCDSTKDGGFQFEPLSARPTVLFRNNICKNVSTLDTNSFGCFYISGSAGGGSYNLTITGNTITNTKAIANVNYGHNILFQNNTIISPNGADGNNVNLENDNDGVTLLSSGNANIFDGTSINIFEDGDQLAWLPRVDRNAVLAMIPWRREEGE